MEQKKRVWIVLALLPVVLLVAAMLYLTALDLNRYKPEISRQLEAVTGRALTIEGDIGLQLSSMLELSVDGVALANASWGSRRPMATIRRLVVVLDPWSLLGDELEILQLRLEEPDLLLERGGDGVGNWVFGPSQPAAAEGGSATALPLIRHLEIRDATLSYLDAGAPQAERLIIKRLEAEATAFSAPLDLQLEGDYNGAPFALTATLDNLVALRQGAPAPLQMRGRWLQAEGRLAARLQLDLARRHYRIDQIDLQLPDNQLQGRLSLALDQQRPRLQATLQSPLLDLTALLAPAESEPVAVEPAPTAVAPAPAPESAGTTAQSEPAPAERLFSGAPLDLSGLTPLDAEIELQLGRLRTPYALLHGVQGRVTMQQQRLQIAPLQFQLGGGQVSGEFTAESTIESTIESAGPLAVALQLHGSGVSLGQLLTDVGRVGQIEGGVTELAITLQGKGYSMAALMADLGGSLLIQSGEGKITNSDLDLTGGDILSQLVRSLNPAATTDSYTRMRCAVAHLQLQQGGCKFDKRVAIETDKMVIVGSGEFDLGSETFTLQMKPSPRQDSVDLGIGAGDLVAAARLHGSFTRPLLGLDPLGSAKAGIKVYQALATGGTSLLLGGLIDKVLSDSHPCKSALEP